MNLRRRVMEVIAGRGGRFRDTQVGNICVLLRETTSQGVDDRQLTELLWKLLSEGLVFADYEGYRVGIQWALTARGRRALEGEAEYEPDDAEGYVRGLQARIPELDELALLYTREALRAYEARCYLASSVMLGVASERCFQILGESFAGWLDTHRPEEAERFRQIFDKPRATYVQKFKEFRNVMDRHKSELPAELSQNMALNLDSMFDLIRINRNDAGHPTGRLNVTMRTQT